MRPEVDGPRVERRLARERRARHEAERIAEESTRNLYETVQELRRSQAVLGETAGYVAILQRVAVAANEAENLEVAARTALAEICHHTGWPVAHLYVTDEPGRVSPTTVWHLDDPERTAMFREITEATVLYAGEGLPGRVLASGRPVWIPDVTRDRNFPRARHARDIGVRAAFALPVLVGAEVVAVLEFFAHESLEPNEPLLEVMAHIGTQLGRVVERSRGRQALRASEEQVRQVIHTANDAFVAIDATGRITEWNHQAELHFGWRREEVLGRLLTETIIPPVHRPAHTAGIARFLATGEGPVLGRRVELEALHRDGHQFPIELTPWAVADGDSYRFNAFIHDITERQAFERQLEHQSLHDSLTGLPNRALLLDRLRHALARARREGSFVAVLFVDLDRFKAVNDSLGHEAGDRLLLGVADRIPAVLRAGDTLARLGGDEFVVLCEELQGQELAVQIAGRIIDGLSSPFLLEGSEAFVSASIGIAVTAGTMDADQLLGDADLAMYRAKERGKGGYELFDESLRTRLVERLATEQALRKGIDEGELVAHYQPVVELTRGTVIGMEALVRWRHPERGLLPPSEFIHLAEDTGMVGRIGEWMLRTACRQIRRWQDRDASEAPLWVAVNLSVRELEQRGLVDCVVELLAANSLAPESLVLEVTESVVMHDIKGVIRRLWELKEVGVRLAIDDFGTGYSSLDRLRRMPVETLKIDQSFINDIDVTPGGTSLVAAIIAMSHSLGLAVVAEGVETAHQLGLLRRLGCDQLQGYLVARPSPAAEFDRLLVDRAGLASIPDAGAEHQAFADIEVELMRVVSQALSDRVDIERTTRSLLAELKRIAGLDRPVRAS
jgi:diguanylate cyclase (GGDEF)-like protein/PAS domain S-box-containing protein